ncbi:carboxypeptidase-like regulatory domain-containing protein [Archangium sp.]|uniref:carboxypeptidase-like regulatory domain-containing protein n=1 Tax=Archangium sp. TaxID=1872627 RepID=UPI002D5D8A47|nr:carboxypeptidase-like regulatory domain-containing protein [Archangium sp.]HYO57840.1 carboxypeptidase-like regulatory domain-containing protein [Archangium sp.]
MKRYVSLLLPVLLTLACGGSAPASRTDEVGGSTAALSTVFSGTVLDASGRPVPGARVTVNGITRLSGTTGTYSISVTAVETGYVLDVRKDGHGPVNEFWTTGQPNRIHRLGKAYTQQLNTQTQNTVLDPSSGIRVVIPANSLLSAVGAPVQPVSFTIAPHDARTMPGDFTARNALGQKVMLDTFGAVTLSAVDAQGNTLGLVSGASLQVRLPVPASLGGSTPPCVLAGSCRAAMWRFDGGTGQWVEQAVPATFDAAGTTFTVTARKEQTTIDPADGLGTWNADVEVTTPACTIIEFSNIPYDCFNPPPGSTPEPGIEVSFTQLTSSGTPKSKTAGVASTATFIALYNLAPNTPLDLSFTFPPGAPASCAANLSLVSSPVANPGFPVYTATGGNTQYNTGAAAPAPGYPVDSGGNPIDFADVAAGDHPCTSHLIVSN